MKHVETYRDINGYIIDPSSIYFAHPPVKKYVYCRFSAGLKPIASCKTCNYYMSQNRFGVTCRAPGEPPTAAEYNKTFSHDWQKDKLEYYKYYNKNN